MSVLEGFWKGFGAILERFRSSKSMKKSITERIDFSSGFFINFLWVFERFLDTFSDGKTVRKSLSREGRFHPFFHSFSKSRTASPNPATLDPFENSRIIRGVRLFINCEKGVTNK